MTNFSVKKGSRQKSLSFFRALNPFSENSGIIYLDSTQEVRDSTVKSAITQALASNSNFLSGLNATFNIIVGTHFNIMFGDNLLAPLNNKGVLDVFILPLLARKLIVDTYQDTRQELTITNDLINAMAWAIAIPIEIARFSAGIALTLLLAPIVALVHLIKTILNCLPNNEEIIIIESNSAEEHPSGKELFFMP